MTSQTVGDTELRKQAHECAERTAIEQGLPPKVEDVVVIRRVLFLNGLPRRERESVKPLR